MNLPERIKLIITESNLKQKDFASSIGVTGSHISKIVKSAESGISRALAELISDRYGYALEWILHGVGPKMKQTIAGKVLTPTQREAITQIENLSSEKAAAVLAFMDSLDKVDSLLKS